MLKIRELKAVSVRKGFESADAKKMTMEEDFDLVKIDQEMRMERIRQSSQKLSWEGFGQALRRNLMEKRLVFDAESRIDVIQAIGFMRRHIPVDTNAQYIEQLKQLAHSLDCSFTQENDLISIKNSDLHMEIQTDDKTIVYCRMGFFGRPLADSPEAKELLERREYEDFRSAVYAILNAVPSANNHTDRHAYVTSLEAVENYFSQQASQTAFEKINTSSYGYIFKRDAVRLTRIYYFVDVHYANATNRTSFDPKTDMNLPYLELSVVSNEKESELPMSPVGEPWQTKKKMPACWCLRFSVPLMISESIYKQLEKYLARYSVIRQHINAYVYTSDFDFKNREMTFRTNLPSHIAAHSYTMSLDFLKEENDVILGEIYLDDIKNLDKVLCLLRTQQMHNTLWESVICATRGIWKGGNTVKLKIYASPTRFELQFTGNHLHTVRIEQNMESKKWLVQCVRTDGTSLSPDVDKQLTGVFNRTNSIPCIVNRAIGSIGARATADPAEPCRDSSNIVASFVDKIGDSWLPQPRRVQPPKSVEHVIEMENDNSPMGFLSSFKELEDVSSSLPNRPETLPRNQRLHSEQSYTHAYSDLEAFCKNADAFDGDQKTTTPLHSAAKFDASSVPPRLGAITQLSPLENARLRMTQSVSSGLPSTPDVFDFPDDRSVGSGSSYPSPSPHANPFAFGSSPNARGGVATSKRRPRQRKAVNMGDRTASTDSLGAAPEPIKRPRLSQKPGVLGTSRRGSTRGSRKSSGLPTPETERPQLQRSFSDYMSVSSFPATPTAVVESPSQEDETDDETCDPPPPPKNLASILSTPAASSPQGSVQAQYVSSPLSQAEALEKTRIQPMRKNSLELLLEAKKPVTPVVTQPVKKSLVSDIYDDGLDSPPAPGLHPEAPSASTAQTTPKIEAPGIVDAGAAPARPDKLETSKLILKIMKQRASPSVDQQKSKEKSGKVDREKVASDKKKKESKKDEKKDKFERSKDDSKRKRKAEVGSRDREHKKHKPSEPPKIETPALPFLQQTLHKNFKIPKKDDKDAGNKEPSTPTTPQVPPPLVSPSSSNPPPFPTGAPSSAGHTLPPINKPNLKKTSMSSAAIRLNLPPKQPATYLPQKKNSTASNHNRRASGGPPPSSLSSIPLPKGPGPERYPSYNPPPVSHSPWVKPPSQPQPHQQPPPRSPSPDAMQIDDSGSPEDTLQIAEE